MRNSSKMTTTLGDDDELLRINSISVSFDSWLIDGLSLCGH